MQKIQLFRRLQNILLMGRVADDHSHAPEPLPTGRSGATDRDEVEENEKAQMARKREHSTKIEIRIDQTTKRIDKKLKDLDNLSIKSCTIFKVNVGLRESNPDAYTPKMVSIGPYYKKNSQLGPMEKYKLMYLRRFLQRKERLDVKRCIGELLKLKEEALKCYEDIQDNSQFCEMLLLDGCFVVEFIRERCNLRPEEEARIIITNRASYIFRDLMLLENQLPFFVLNQLHSMTKQNNESSLVILVNKLFRRFAEMLKKTSASFSETECNNIGSIKHLLHLLHIFSCNPMKKSNNDKTCHMVLPNATELSEAGVNFAKVSDMTSLLDIKFEKGLMTIPCFQVEDGTETLLRNLIAYEQQSSDVRSIYFSDYAIFMDHLIDSDKDVSLLRQKGIIVNWTADDKQVASLFNKLGNGVTTYPDFYYKEEFRLAVEYSEKPWNRMKANLKHN
ncbi:putative UPF0481 protein At3g02645 [Solanum stenotomum]|uniref:putative UPF0481 protein At3g02645 n=1 Tax=Solanum stenotomum TaxID=172797 RepID=UPI0020D147E6|nr:putative UPF0481 protein At3g02645 [Solanum stenotomum]